MRFKSGVKGVNTGSDEENQENTQD